MLHAQQSPPAPDQDPFVGTWRANAAQSKPKLNKTEASYERVIAREGDALVFSSTGGAFEAANARSYRLKCDGRIYPLPRGPLSRCAYASPNRVDGETGDPTGKRHYWTREVSPDGKQMTISAYTDILRPCEQCLE